MMDSIWLVLGLALLPALGNFSGGLAAEASRTTGRRLSYALHGAAGLVIAVVAVEIMPRVLENLSAWVIALAFALGGIAYVGIEKLVESLQKRQGQQGEGGQTSVWMIYIAVSVANGCSYCVHSHTAAAKAKGMSEDEHGELMQIVALAASTNHLVTALQVPVDPEFDVK